MGRVVQGRRIHNFGSACCSNTGNHEFYDPQVRQKKNLNKYWRPGFTLPSNGPAGLEETAYSFDYRV